MIKKIFPYLTILMLALFVGACSNEDIMPDIDAGVTGRTITFTASMPDEDAPSTRVTAEELASRAITLKWEENDRIDFLFVQGEKKKSSQATVTSVDTEGKNATFTIALPDGIDPANAYTLYGVYGGSGDITDGKIGVTAQTAEDNVGKNIMLRFEKDVAANSDNIENLQFEHVGFLFTTKIKVTAGEIADIKLVAADGSNWIYNASDYEFNIEAGAFTTTATATNAAPFYIEQTDETITARSWFPAIGQVWPALNLSINNGTKDVVSTTSKSAGNTPAAGKAYYIYAKYDGADLVFSKEGFPEPESVYADDLFFSEYIEGSSNNKYLEIYNGTGADVDLSDYQVELYANGRLESAGTTSKQKLSDLQLVLNHGEVIVLKNSSAGLDYTGAYISSVCNFSGDDAIVLRKISTGNYVDIIGRIGEQTNWSAGGNLLTTDRTLVRKPTVTGGVTENPASGFPTLATEWIGYPIDTHIYLGSHETDFGAFFGADETPVEFESSLNLTKVINISTSETWNARSSDESWLKVTHASGTGSGNVTLTATENTAATPRTATVTLTATGANAFDPIVVTVTQKAFEATIVTDPTELSFSSDAGSETIAVTANVEWTASSDAGWATISPASGTNNGTITVNVEANKGEAERTATITITGDGVTETVAVSQKSEVTSPPGSYENPFDAADIADNQGQNGVWVRAFIVGSDNGGLKIGITGSGASGTNIVISDNINASTEAEIVRVELPTGAGRTGLNLKDNPGMLKAEVYLKGNLVAYFGKPGLKGVKEYEVISLNE